MKLEVGVVVIYCHTIVSLTGETVEVGVVVIYSHTIVSLTGETRGGCSGYILSHHRVLDW